MQIVGFPMRWLKYPLQGNIEYEAQDDVHDLAEVKTKQTVADVAKLLSVTTEDLTKALTHRVIAAGGNVVDKGLTVSEAYYARDAFAKVLFYSFLKI